MTEKPASETNFFIQIPWMYENNLGFYLRNLLTSIAIGMLCYYNIRYTNSLYRQMGNHVAFRHGVRCKILSISILIQVCLVMRFVWIWMANYFWWSDHGARDYLAFEATFFTLSEIVPFLIFCVVLTCRIRAYSKDYKMIRESMLSKASGGLEQTRRDSDVSNVLGNKMEIEVDEDGARYEDLGFNNSRHTEAPADSSNNGSFMSETRDDPSEEHGKDRKQSADFGPLRYSNTLDLGPLNQVYREG